MATQTSVPAEVIEDVIARALAKWLSEAARISRAADMLRAGNMIRTFYTDASGEKKYMVNSQMGPARYFVTEDVCDCPDHQNRPTRMCKHRWLVYLHQTAEIRAAVLAARAERDGALTEREKRRLSLWKWQYHLETNGFSKQEANGLLFARYRAWHNGQTKDRTEVA